MSQLPERGLVLERCVQHRRRLDEEAEALLVALPFELRFAAGGDVASDSHHAHRRSVDVAVDLSHRQKPVHGAVRPQHPQLGLVVPTPLHRGRDRLAHGLTIVGVHPIEEGVERALELAGPKAEQSLHVLRPRQVVREDAPVPDPNASGFDRELEPLLRLSARGQVDEARDHQLGSPRLSPDRDGLVPQPATLAIGKGDADEQLLGLAGT